MTTHTHTNSNDESSSDSSPLENDDKSDKPGQVQTNATSKTPDTEVWEKIETLQNDSRKLNFDFNPAKFQDYKLIGTVTVHPFSVF